ncbi:hypothetical protein, partial [Thermodesulfitimonas autotrophica]|uniref:hypothetical protein n=1 Tax=Thermodesulfitimonas autotrophica TaxID=1894989 RepID=UPI002FDF89DA
MDVYALLYDDGQGAVTQWKVSSWAPPEKAEYDIRVMAQRPQILPNIAIALVENGMRCARECLLRKYPIFRSKAGGPLLFTVDLAGITTPVQPPASLALSAALAFLADLAGSLPELPRAVAATGAVDLKERRVTRVNHINEKIEAALHAKNASGAYLLGAGDLILYPEENDAEIDSRLRTQAQARGVILTPVRYVDEALRLILGEKGTAWERLRKLPRWHWRKAAASFAAALFLYFLLGYPWPLRGPAVTVTAPAAQSQASWQDPGVKRWLEEPAVLQGKDACYLVEGRIEAPGFLRLFKDLRLRVTVATAGGKYPQPETTLTRWSGRFRARIWLDRRLPDANLRLELCQGEKLLAVREITFRDGPPAPQWSLAVKNNVLEVGYRSGDGFPQVAALHTDSGALRLTYLPDGGWGASLYPFAWWEGGRFIRGGRALETDGQLLFRAVADNADPQSLKLRVVLEAADWEITLRPPEDGT